MGHLKLDLWTCDIGAAAGSAVEFSGHIVRRVIQSWDEGADIVVFPEFSWMGLERFVTSTDKLAGVAELFWESVWPDVREQLSRPGKAVLLGTVPFRLDGGKFKNR